MRRTLLLAVGAVALLAASTTACRDHTVQVAFRPEVGAQYRYEVTARAESVTVLEGAAPERRTEEIDLIAEHTVLASDEEGVRVRVLLGRPGTPAQVFIVRFDETAQLASVESAENVPAEVAGTLGISEIFPAAAGAPPDRRLAPGDTWRVHERVAVPGAAEPSLLAGEGRLVALGEVDGEHVARVSSTALLPLSAVRSASGSTILLRGSQRIEQHATHDLDDGAIRSATAETVGTFVLRVDPPAGAPGAPVPGTLEVRVRSESRRID